MKLILFFALIVGVIQCQQIDLPRLRMPPAKGRHAEAKAITWGTITQRVDNFDPKNSKTFEMRYVENDQFFQVSGPIFILLGGEGPVGSDWLQYGWMYEMAMENYAHLFALEHRYYGESLPVKTKWKWASYKYLSADQAMADFANFIRIIKAERPELTNSKVVVFGASYSANLATWMRKIYPDIVHAAVSSSAPVLAKVDFNEYMQVVADVLVDCKSTIQNGLDQIKTYMKTILGRAKIKKDLCVSNIAATAYHKQVFYWNMAAKFAHLIQYAGPTTPSTICSQIQDNNLASDYDKFVNYMTNCKRSDSERSTRTEPQSWFYQTCAEFGYLMSSSSPNQPFYDTFPVDLWLTVCKNGFGIAYNSKKTYTGVENTNQKFGGISPNINRVVSVHGTWDPWHALGMKASWDPELPVYVVPGVSHCADVQAQSENDPPELLEAKQGVKIYVKYWLSLD